MAQVLGLMSHVRFDSQYARRRVGEVLPITTYVNALRPTLPRGEAVDRLFVVTHRPAADQLWLIAILEQPDATWRAASNQTPILDITSLRTSLALVGPMGVVDVAPRVLTPAQVALLPEGGLPSRAGPLEAAWAELEATATLRGLKVPVDVRALFERARRVEGLEQALFDVGLDLTTSLDPPERTDLVGFASDGTGDQWAFDARGELHRLFFHEDDRAEFVAADFATLVEQLMNGNEGLSPQTREQLQEAVKAISPRRGAEVQR